MSNIGMSSTGKSISLGINETVLIQLIQHDRQTSNQGYDLPYSRVVLHVRL